jgi:hypothetical protein
VAVMPTPTPASPSGKAGVVRGGLLQRDPDPEEPEAPLVEARVPNGSFLVTPVVDGAIAPLPAGRWERSVPRRPRRLTPSPGRGSVAPRGFVEIAAVGIPAPWAGPSGAARSTWTVRVEVSGSARAVCARPARSTRAARCARAVVARSARIPRSARITGAAWTAGSRRIVGSAWSQRWRCGRGVRHTGAHTQCRCAKRTGDGSPGNQLLQSHDPSPVSSEFLKFPATPTDAR